MNRYYLNFPPITSNAHSFSSIDHPVANNDLPIAGVHLWIAGALLQKAVDHNILINIQQHDEILRSAQDDTVPDLNRGERRGDSKFNIVIIFKV